MALPKQKKQIKDKVDKALDIVEAMNRSQERRAPVPAKNNKGGRPSAIPNRAVKMSLLLTQETHDRFSLAFPQEQLKRREHGERVDKSSLIEHALKAWLDENEY
jgi:hypothetical protein